MKNLKSILLVFALLFALLAIYYGTSGIYHFFTFSSSPYTRHVKHVIGFVVLAMVCIVAALANRNAEPKSQLKEEKTDTATETVVAEKPE